MENAHQKNAAPQRYWYWLLGTVLVSLALVTALFIYGASTPLLPSQRSAGESASSPLSLWEEPEIVDSPLVTEEEADPYGGYHYEEILSHEDGILLARIQGKRYKGVLAVVEDPTRVFVGSIPYFSQEGYGMKLDTLMERYDAVLGLNGGGFDDTQGQGRGAAPIGLVLTDGKIWYGGARGSYDVCAFDENGKLYVGRQIAQDLLDAGVHSAVSFGPALIIDGEIQEFKNIYWEPRSAVGQREDGSILLMALEGRQVAAQGADYATLAAVMAEYGAINATNLDGGASSSLLYKGEMVNICNAINGLRLIPNGILVRASDAGEEDAA